MLYVHTLVQRTDTHQGHTFPGRGRSAPASLVVIVVIVLTHLYTNIDLWLAFTR